MSELSPVEELQERYRSAADEYPDPDGLAAALRAAAIYCTRERRILMTIADELENHQ